MTTPGFRTVYLDCVDEPGIHPPCQVGHPDRQEGGSDWQPNPRTAIIQIWTKGELEEVVRLWNQGLSAAKIGARMSKAGRGETAIRHKLNELRASGSVFLRTARPSSRVKK